MSVTTVPGAFEPSPGGLKRDRGGQNRMCETTRLHVRNPSPGRSCRCMPNIQHKMLHTYHVFGTFLISCIFIPKPTFSTCLGPKPKCETTVSTCETPSPPLQPMIFNENRINSYKNQSKVAKTTMSKLHTRRT